MTTVATQTSNVTITGDRQSSKTYLLVGAAIDQAARLGQRVEYWCRDHTEAAEVMRQLETRSMTLLPDLVDRVRWTNGDLHVRYVGGGVVHVVGRRGKRRTVGIRIVDDVPDCDGTEFLDATSVYRAVVG